MKLSYRGCQYQKETVSLARRQQPVKLQYRGVSYTLTSENPIIYQPNSLLKYRGIPYQISTSSTPSFSSPILARNSAIA